MGSLEVAEGLTYGWAVLLGIVQGLTEFLPVSSSGHLALAQHLGMDEPMSIAFDILLHVATVLVVLGILAKDIVRYIRTQPVVLLYVALASVPTGIIGIAFKDRFEALREMPLAVCGALGVTALVLVVMEKYGRGERPVGRTGAGASLLIGLAQSVAIMPGISRSGSTIAAGTLLGLAREDAVKFSFLLMCPAVLGAAVIKAIKNPDEVLALDPGPCAAGFVAAALSGWLAARVLIYLVKQRRMLYFAAYCGALAIAGAVWFSLFDTV